MPDKEAVPDGDGVSRHLFAPGMGSFQSDLVWDAVFMFRSDRGCAESLVWRKYAPTIEDVHALGCDKQSSDRNAGKNITYFGALSANVGTIRALRSLNGFRFYVEHEPVEGQHHLHIGYFDHQKLSKNDKTELRKLLRDRFSERSDHVCPEAA